MSINQRKHSQLRFRPKSLGHADYPPVNWEKLDGMEVLAYKCLFALHPQVDAWCSGNGGQIPGVGIAESKANGNFGFTRATMNFHAQSNSVSLFQRHPGGANGSYGPVAMLALGESPDPHAIVDWMLDSLVAFGILDADMKVVPAELCPPPPPLKERLAGTTVAPPTGGAQMSSSTRGTYSFFSESSAPCAVPFNERDKHRWESKYGTDVMHLCMLARLFQNRMSCKIVLGHDALELLIKINAKDAFEVDQEVTVAGVFLSREGLDDPSFNAEDGTFIIPNDPELFPQSIDFVMNTLPKYSIFDIESTIFA